WGWGVERRLARLVGWRSERATMSIQKLVVMPQLSWYAPWPGLSPWNIFDRYVIQSKVSSFTRMPTLARSRWIHSAMATGIIWPEPEVDVQNVVSKPFARPASLSRALALSGS